ncbi:MAG: M81 family metallopeptidase [Candidatus Delongbacteria bacterium]|nr:M81 family metallopeptidase [Candidatus Delongbacteria bacterium]MBN2835450.1 M81 family metallopeptidase [Candidatus Delongbacteria bacterium]
MKVLVAGIFHESNTLNPIITQEDDFYYNYGEDFRNFYQQYNSARGIITFFDEKKIETVLSVFARAVPNGRVSQAFFDEIIRTLINDVESNEIDAVVLALHGSMQSEHIEDVEGYILRKIKAVKNLPVFLSLDMHAIITDDIINLSSGIAGYQTAPHIDTYETGYRAAKLAYDFLVNNKQYKISYKRIPLLFAGEMSETNTQPMKKIMEKIKNLESCEIPTITLFMGFPWTDRESNSAVLLITSNANTDVAKIIDDLTEMIFSLRNEFTFSMPTYSVNVAVDLALTSESSPFFISDSGDNPTAGATADNTSLLSVLISKNLNGKKIIYGGFYDPQAIIDLENGKKEINLGGKFDPYSEPVKLDVKVLKYIRSTKLKCDIFLVAYDSLEIIIASKHIGFSDTKPFDELDLDLNDYDIVIVKLGYLTPEFEKFSSENIMALTSGCSNEDLTTIGYKRLQRPIFPIDRI